MPHTFASITDLLNCATDVYNKMVKLFPHADKPSLRFKVLEYLMKNSIIKKT